MELTRVQKKAKLQVKVAVIIERLLDWEEENRQPNLTQIEEEVLNLREQFGQDLVSVVIEGQAARQPAESPQCAQCGKAMRYKGIKKKVIESRLGGLEVERGNYYCQDCASGLFPPGSATWVRQWAVE
jgi:hypothetical protein